MDLTKYNEVKDDMKTGDILSWKSKSLIGSLIRWKTGGEANHSSMVIRLSEYEGTERRRYHTEAMERGVYPNLLSQRLQEYDGEVWWLPLKDEYNEARICIGQRLTECWGKPYDYKSIFTQLFAKVSVNMRRMFCSEVVYYALGGTGKAPNPNELENMGYNKDKVKL